MSDVHVTVSPYKDSVRYQIKIWHKEDFKDSIDVYDRATLEVLLTTLGEERLKDAFANKEATKDEKRI